MTSIIDTGANGAAGANGTIGAPGASGGSGSGGGGGTLESTGISGTDISSSADDLNAQITGGNGGVGGGGGGGGSGLEPDMTYGPGGGGGIGGDGGAGGSAMFDLTNDTIGSAAAPAADEIDISLGTIGGSGATAGNGGGGGSTGVSNPDEGIVGSSGGNGGTSGNAGAGADATDTVTDLTADMAFGGTIRVAAMGGAGGTTDETINPARGGGGDKGGSGGTAAAGGDGGNAAASLTDSALTAGRSLQIDLSAQGGQGGDASPQAGGGTGENAGFDGGNGVTANGGDAGNATATLSGNTIAVGTAAQNGILTLDAEVRTYTASEGSVNAALTAAIGLPGATAPGHITVTGNTVTLGAGTSVQAGASFVLELSDTTIQTNHEFVSEPTATETLNAGVGGNLDFNGNSFDGGGGGSITLEVAGGGVIVDTLHNTISIGGSVNNAFIGFNTFQLDSNDTFVAGRDDYSVTVMSGDTVDFTAGTGNLTLVADGGSVSTDGLALNFEGFGTGLDAAALAADTSVVSGNSIVTIGAQTLEILNYTGSLAGFSNFGDLPTEIDIVVTVAQMEGFAASHTLPSSGSTYIVTDTAADIEAVTATQLRSFAANGASAIISTDASLAFTVADALQLELQLTASAPSGDSVTLTDTAANIETLTTTQIAKLSGTGITGIVSTDATVALSLAQGEAFVASGLTMSVPTGDGFIIADTYVALENLTTAQILTLKATGVTGLMATVGSPVFTVAQAMALEDPLPVSVTPGNTVSISDTAADIETLGASDIAALSKIGFTGFTSTDASVLLTVAQAEAIGVAGIALTVPSHDTITVADTAANIEAMTKGDIFTLHEAGVSAIAATDGSVVLSITQAQGLEYPLPVTVPTGDTLTITDTAANIEGLRAGDIGQLSQIGFTAITATDTSVVLTVADAEAFAAGKISLIAPMGDTVTVADTAANIEALTATNIAALQTAGVTGIVSTDMSVALSSTQTTALAAAGIAVTVPAGDTVSYSDTIQHLEALTVQQIAALASSGVTVVTPTDAGSPGFSVAQTLAFESADIRLSVPPPGDTAYIADTAADIETLTPEQIAALPGAGFLALNSFGELMTLSLPQVEALEAAKISVPSGTITVEETAAQVEALQTMDIVALHSVGVGAIAADGPVSLTASQALIFAPDGISIVVPMGDTVAVADTAATIGALASEDIDTLSAAGVTVLRATDAALTFTLAQVQNLEGVGFQVSAPKGDAVTLTALAADIEALAQSDITALQMTGITTVKATDAGIVLTAAAIQLFENANIVLQAPAGDAVTVSDSAGNIASLTDIGALAAVGVTALQATDGSLTLTVAQAVTLLGDKIGLSVPTGDGVTLADTEGAVEKLNQLQIAGLQAIGVTGIEVPSLTGIASIDVPKGLTFTVDGAISSGQAISFSGPGGTLALADPGDDAGTISNFGTSDTIDLTTIAFDPTGTAQLIAGNGLGVIESGVGYVLQLDPKEAFLGGFVLSDDGHGGSEVTVGTAPVTSFVTISSGQTASSFTIVSGGSIDILAGGMVVGAAVSSGASLSVESGGAISGGTVYDGGILVVASGGEAVGVLLADPGSQTVQAGGKATDTTISGGEQDLYGSASSTVIDSGSQIVFSGGVADKTTVSAGALLEIESGGTASGVTVLSGGTILLNGGTVTGLKLNAGAIEEIDKSVASGQTVSHSIVSSGVTQTIYSGGKAAATTIEADGNQYVYGSASGTVISGPHGYQYVFSGGVANGTIIRNGGVENVYTDGATFGTVVSSGGQEIAQISGHANSVTVSNGGILALDSGGTASGAHVLSGGELLFAGGSATAPIVASGGVEIVLQGVTVSGLTVSSGATLTVSLGATASGTHVLKGGEIIYEGGAFVGTVISSGGSAGVAAQNTVKGLTVSSGGTLFISSGAIASATHVLKGGELVYDGGAIVGAVIGSGGSAGVAAGVKVTGLTVSSGTALFVSSGGTASTTHVLKDGELVYDGGAIIGPIVSSGGSVGVAPGVKVTGLTVGSGTTLFVSSGATASTTHVLKGGELVYDGGTVVGAVISSGGSEGVAAGVKVAGLTVGNGATLFVSSGAVASNTVLNSGTEIVSAGGLVGGVVTFDTKARLSVATTPTSTTLAISGFKETDTLDLAAFGFKSTDKLTFVENAAKTKGVLTISSGALHASVTLFGQYVAGGFRLASDGAAGTAVTYISATAAHLELAGNHG